MPNWLYSWVPVINAARMKVFVVCCCAFFHLFNRKLSNLLFSELVVIFLTALHSTSEKNCSSMRRTYPNLFCTTAFELTENGDAGIIRGEYIGGKRWKEEDVFDVVSFEISPTSAKPPSCWHRRLQCGQQPHSFCARRKYTLWNHQYKMLVYSGATRLVRSNLPPPSRPPYVLV